MSKRYRLVIPKKVNRDDFEELYQLIGLHGEEIEDAPGFFSSKGLRFSEIPKEWLTEIKEPDNFEEWADKEFGLEWFLYDSYEASDLKKVHEWTEENERKKHEPKQSFSEVLETGKLSEFCQCKHCKEAYRQGWDACEENRGFNE